MKHRNSNMENKLKLKANNIGVFKEVELQINQLTVLAGVNGSGKSTLSKLVYLLLNGQCNFNKSFYKDFEKQVDRITFEASYPFFQGDLFAEFVEDEDKDKDKDKDEVVKNKDNSDLLNDYIKKLSKDNFLKTSDIKEIILLLKDMGSAGEEYSQLLEDYLESDNESKISQTIISRLIKAEFASQLRSIGATDFSTSLESNESNITLNNINAKYTFKFDNLGFSSIFYLGNYSFFDIEKKRLNLRRNRYNFTLDHNEAIINALKPGNTDKLLSEEIKNNQFIDKYNKILEQILGGSFEYDDANKEYYFSEKGKLIHLDNVASGMKSIATLQLLIKNGCLDNNSMLIMDEPESNLHPLLQVKIAELLVKLVNETDIVIFVNSHSPYFIEALSKFSAIQKGKRVIPKLYQVEIDNNEGKLKDFSDDINGLFAKLVEPYKYIDGIVESNDVE